MATNSISDALFWKMYGEDPEKYRRRASPLPQAPVDAPPPPAPPSAMPMQMAPAPTAPTATPRTALPAVGGGYVPGQATDRFMVDAPAKPMAPWPEDWSDLPTAGELPEAPQAPATGVFRGGRPWTPTAPGAMGSDEFAADVAGRAAGRRASAGLDRDVRANAALSERIGKMGEALGQPIPKNEWDDYNQRTRESAMRMGIGAPDPENDRDMAVWAQGQTNVAGQMRRSPQERAEARGGADRYRGEQESARNRETQVRMADAEREGEWGVSPTGEVFNKRTGDVRPSTAPKKPNVQVVGKTVVQIQDDGTAKVLYDGGNSKEKIRGYTMDEFIEMDKNSWNFEGTTRDNWLAFRDEWMAEAQKRGQKKETPAAAGGGGFRVFK